MSLQPKLERPQWLIDAGEEPLNPRVFASYKDELKGKDLSGLQIQKTRYYCSLLNKNDIDIRDNPKSRAPFRRNWELYPWSGKIGPFRNIPQWIWHNNSLDDEYYGNFDYTSLYHQNEPIDGIFASAHRATLPSFRDNVFSRYQTTDNLKHNLSMGWPMPNRRRFLTHWSFCEPKGVLKPVWQNFNLSNSSLKSADLRYIDLSSATLTGIQSGGVIANSHTKLPRGWIASGGYLLGKTADLRHGDLSGITIQNIDLSQAKLDDIKSQNLVGKPKKIATKLEALSDRGINNKGVLIGPKADLQDTNLGDLDLSSLSNNDLKYIKSGNTKGTPILPIDWSKRNGMLLGPKANLNGSDLTGVNLKNTYLHHADLRESTLTDVKSGSIKGIPMLPEGYQLGNGYIFGPRVISAMRH